MGIDTKAMKITGISVRRTVPVILGTHGHGAIAGLVMGSVATKVVSLCSTPVLLIR